MVMKAWMVDLARETSLTTEHLLELGRVSVESGYDTLGLYLEHRFAYPSIPWAHGVGAIEPEAIRTLEREFPNLCIVPFINLLGHFEGFLYTEEGRQYREATLSGLQACPRAPGFVDLCERLIDDTLACFRSELIHIGGDETAQLGQCPRCQSAEKAELYANHFGPLAERVHAQGRRPAVWGDMFLEHPTALDALPADTVIFDWQYFNGVKESSPKLGSKGHPVVGCPALHLYNAAWMHARQTEANIREVAADARDLDLHGVCVTLWETGLFGAMDTCLPAIRWAGRLLNGEQGELLSAYSPAEAWARRMSDDLAGCGGVFAFSGRRSSLKCRLLLYGNPFLAWMHHHEELGGEVGERALRVVEEALIDAPGEAEQGVCLFVRGAVEFVRLAERAHQAYAAGQPEACIALLASTRLIFDTLETVARRSQARFGGSVADPERCRVAKEHVEKVIARVRRYGDRQLGYLPAFEVLTHPKFMPHDQGCWWIVNQWANQ